MHVEPFYDQATGTLSYVVHDAGARDAVVIDPVLDYDPASSTISNASVDAVIAYLRREDLEPRMIVETHAHADHLSGSQVLKARFDGAQVGIGARIVEVQRAFKHVFDLPADFATDGRQFDRLFADGEVVDAGAMRFEVIATPGHTPACVSYRFGDAIFTGDALFMPDMGTGRCDFPAGSAADLYESITTRLYALPDATRLFVGHDYQPGGRALAFETTVGAQKESNVHLPATRSKQDFVRFRTERDAGLASPRLLFQSIQVNVDAGSLPAASGNAQRYLKIPINAFRPPTDLETIVDEPVR